MKFLSIRFIDELRIGCFIQIIDVGVITDVNNKITMCYLCFNHKPVLK